MRDILWPALAVAVLLMLGGIISGGAGPEPGDPGYDCGPSLQVPVC